MRIVRPIAIGASVLTSSSVRETVPTAYAGGTTYADGDFVSVAGANNSHTVYESLAGSNTGHTPASSPTWWGNRGTVYGAYAGGTTYALGDIVTDTTNHLLYESNAAGNIGNALTTAFWSEIGPANKWAAFDSATATTMDWNGEIVIQLTTTGIVDVIGCLNMEGVVNVAIVATADAVEVLNTDFDTVSDGGIGDWWEYFFEPLNRQQDLAITDLVDLAIDPDAVLVLTLTFTGPEALSIGEIVIGRSRDIGATQYGLGLSILDYSKIETDDFGVRAIVQRDYAKRMSAEVWVDTADTSFVFALLASLRATPVMAIGSDLYSASVQYGLLKDWRERIAYPQHSILDLDFEGM